VLAVNGRFQHAPNPEVPMVASAEGRTHLTTGVVVLRGRSVMKRNARSLLWVVFGFG
jgi:hypothetical protein